MKLMSKKTRRLSVLGTAVATVAALAGCSSAAAKPVSATTAHQTITFWSGAAGMNVLVNAFNKTHKDITVKLGAVPSGQAAYEKIQSAVQAGSGPDVAMIEYQEIPTLAAAGILQNVTSLTSQYKSLYQPAAWNAAGFLGKQYGLPHDIGPMVMYYNASLFKKAGIAVPTTWAQFKSEAVTLKQKTGAAMGSYLNYGLFLAAISAQAGAHWFGTANNSWQVDINSAATQKAFNYWTSLTNSGGAIENKGFNAGYWNDLDTGKIATYIVGAWGYRGLEGNLKATSGDWRVAPVPQWNASDPVNANIGGSVTAIMKGTKHAQADIEFAKWLTTSPTAFKLAYANSGFYPATVNGASAPEYETPDPFFGGQKVGAVYAKAASEVDPSWQWGPVMTDLNTNFQDALPASVTAGNANTMLTSIQSQTVSEMKSVGFSVSGK